MNNTQSNLLLVPLASLLKLVGTVSLWVAPSIGWVLSARSCIALFCVRTALASLTGSVSWYLPSLAGSLVLSSSSRYIGASISAGCTLLFLVHPVGYASWPYALYWLIPIGLGIAPHPSIFNRAVISTYTTHAVGSVLWLYTHDTTALYWYELIGHVWLERLQYAAALTACYYVITYCSTLVRIVDDVKTSSPLSRSVMYTCHS